MLGWTREKVKNYAALSSLDIRAWEIIGTTITDATLVHEESNVPSNGTGVPFTENLLRPLIPLTPSQQTLVSTLAMVTGTKKAGREGRPAFFLR